MEAVKKYDLFPNKRQRVNVNVAVEYLFILFLM